MSRTRNYIFDLFDKAARVLGRVSLRLRSPSGSFILAVHRDIPGFGVAVPFAFFGLHNPSGSGKVLYLRRIVVYLVGSDKTGASVPGVATAITFFTLEKGDTLAGGVDISTEIVQKDDSAAASIANVLKRESDAEAALTVASNEPIRRASISGWGFGHFTVLLEWHPDPELDDQIVLRETDALALRATANAPSTGLSYVAVAEWDEE